MKSFVVYRTTTERYPISTECGATIDLMNSKMPPQQQRANDRASSSGSNGHTRNNRTCAIQQQHSISLSPAIPLEPNTSFTLLTNAKLWNGHELSNAPIEILIHKHQIRKIGTLVPVPQDAKMVKIDCGGHTVLPGMVNCSASLLEGNDPILAGALCAHQLQQSLQQGVTCIRDVGGGALRGVAQSLTGAPRLFSSGRKLVTMASDDVGCYCCESGPDAVASAARKVLQENGNRGPLVMQVSGSLETNDLMATHFTLDELKAAVQVAADFGTYVTAVRFSSLSRFSWLATVTLTLLLYLSCFH